MTEEQVGGHSAKQAGDGGSTDKGAAAGGVGAATDALAAFGTALGNATEAKPASTADPRVSGAFAVGWHMSELYEMHSPAKEQEPPDLPGLGSLSQRQRVAILVDQVEAGIEKLKDPIAQSGLDPIDLTELKSLSQPPAAEDPVLRTHLQLLGELTAADPRLGKAYGLGRALADTCREASDGETLKNQLNPRRIANLLRWLDDLATAFPAHAADGVAGSLKHWRDALYPPPAPSPAVKVQDRWNVNARWRGRKGPASYPPVDPDRAVSALLRQGELWRALLSGEKQGTDMLEMDNYVDAAAQVASRTAAVLRRAVLRMPLIGGLILVLVGVGVYFLVQGSTAQLVGGVTSVLVAVGLTWKGVGGALGKLAGKLEQPLWGAVLDDAIADAITLLPGNSADKRGRRQIAVTLANSAGQPEPPSPG